MLKHFKEILPILLLAISVVLAQQALHAMEKDFCLTQVTMALYYTIVVIGLCLLMGYAGQVSLGHGAFFAIGGYTSAVLTTYDFGPYQANGIVSTLARLHLLGVQEDSTVLSGTPWAAFAAAMLLTFIVAALVGYPALRLKGHYLAMATLGFGIIVNKIAQGTALFGAADGINGVPAWHILPGLAITGGSERRIENYYFAAIVVLILLVLMRNLSNSRVGRALQSIHDGETAANAAGINTSMYKLQTFVASALLAAMAGVFFTHYTGGISPSEAGALKSVRYVALTAAGGMANPWGTAVLSTTVNFFSLRDWFGSYDNAVFGAILIIIISITPEGPLKPIGLWIRRNVLRMGQPSPGSEQG